MTPTPMPTPAPLPIGSPAATSPTMRSSAPPPSRFYDDDQGVHRAIYLAGGSITVSCKAMTTCRLFLGADAAAPAAPGVIPSGWHVMPETDGEPVVEIFPETGAPDTGIVIKTKMRTYGLLLHVDENSPNAAYGYLFPDEHGHVLLPQRSSIELDPTPETTTPEHANAPIAPVPCPSTYRVISQNNPGFWPHRVWIESGGVVVSFPANGIIPLTAVPEDAPHGDSIDLNQLANISQGGGVDGSDRLVRIQSCYPTIVLYTGFGRDRRAVILQAQP